ncbi:MAG TPA: hypothetical protein VGH28_24865 [Polyangiaceae bacterium]
MSFDWRVLRVISIAALLGAGVGPAMAGCGARTELNAPIVAEAGKDVTVDQDATEEEEDAQEEDALPHIDQFVDAPIPTDCPDAGATLVYVISAENDLLSFYPPTLQFTNIGKIACPGTTSTPYSMAVDRFGTAYSVFADGTLWQIDTANAACKSTPYVPSEQGTPFFNFGMGYAGDQNGESLYVADANFNSNSLGLATLDTKSFTRHFIADFQPELPRCELTGTGDGRLFALCVFTSGSGSEIAEIDPQSAKIVAVNQLKTGQSTDAFAYAFWGGSFWIFHGPGGSTSVVQYDPIAMTETTVTTLAQTIVGAGVSTCAPQ